MEELDPKGDIWPYLGTFCCCLQRVMIGELVRQRCWGKKNNLTKCMVAPHTKQKLPILKYQLCPGGSPDLHPQDAQSPGALCPALP